MCLHFSHCFAESYSWPRAIFQGSTTSLINLVQLGTAHGTSMRAPPHCCRASKAPTVGVEPGHRVSPAAAQENHGEAAHHGAWLQRCPSDRPSSETPGTWLHVGRPREFHLVFPNFSSVKKALLYFHIRRNIYLVFLPGSWHKAPKTFVVFWGIGASFVTIFSLSPWFLTKELLKAS